LCLILNSGMIRVTGGEKIRTCSLSVPYGTLVVIASCLLIRSPPGQRPARGRLCD
jgi:hypothetical protein